MSLDKLHESPSLEMINLVFEMKTKGKEVLSLAPGDPSFDTPREIVEVAYRSMLEGGTHYVHSYGTLDVRNAIMEKVRRKNGIAAKLENTIFVTAKLAVFALARLGGSRAPTRRWSRTRGTSTRSRSSSRAGGRSVTGSLRPLDWTSTRSGKRRARRPGRS